MSGNVKFRFLLAPIVVALFVVTSPVVSWASETAYVNIKKAIINTNEWKKEFASFKAVFEKEKASIATKEKYLKKMIEDLYKQSMVLSPELKKKKEEALIRKKKDFEQYVQDKNQAFAKTEKDSLVGAEQTQLDIMNTQTPSVDK